MSQTEPQKIALFVPNPAAMIRGVKWIDEGSVLTLKWNGSGFEGPDGSAFRPPIAESIWSRVVEPPKPMTLAEAVQTKAARGFKEFWRRSRPSRRFQLLDRWNSDDHAIIEVQETTAIGLVLSVDDLTATDWVVEGHE